MDSIKVFLDGLQQESSSWWTIIRDISPLLVALASIGGTVVAVYAIRKSNESRLADLRHNKELKELEHKEAERQRKFLIQRGVTERALEVLQESYHRTHQINIIYNYPSHEITEEQRQSLWDQVKEIRHYWEKNYWYLPPKVHNHVYRLTNAFSTMLPQGDFGNPNQRRVFEEISQMFKDIEESLREFMHEYNLLYQVDSEAKKE